MNNIQRAGVVGWPVSHSLSPVLQNYWLQKYTIAGEYRAYPVEIDNLPDFIKGLRDDENFKGVNLTIPHKEKILPLLDEVDAIATKIGAANTVIHKNGKLYGTNTDAYGFAENIKPFITGKKKAVVLGAGGAAKAVFYALKELGFAEIILSNRTIERAQTISATVASWEKRSQILEDADLLVNTTSLGMRGKEELDIDLSLLPKKALVTDIVYTPLMTPLLMQAQERGNNMVDGLGMLLHQAVPAFEAWFAVRPEVNEALRNYILSGIT